MAYTLGIDKLLMVERAIRGGIYHAIHQYVKANNKYMKDFDKNKESSYLKYWDVSNLYGWTIFTKITCKMVLSASKIHLSLIKIS